MLPTVVSMWYPVVSPCVLPGLWLKIRLEMLSLVVSTSWFPPRGVVVSTPPHGVMVSCLVFGSKLDWKCCPLWCRGFHPHGVVVSCLVFGSKLDWKCCPLWCHGFHPHGVVVSCLVCGLKLDWKFVSVVSPK